MNRVLVLGLLVLALASQAVAAPAAANLVAMKRKYFANCLWSLDRARIGGQEVEGTLTGLGGNEDAVMVYELNGQFEMLESMVGYVDSAPDHHASVFEVWADGELLQRVGPLHSGQDPEMMRVPLKERKVLTLRIVPQSYNATHGAAWGAPTLWTGLQGKFPGSLLLNVDGHTTMAVPSMRGQRQEVPIPIPLEPGVREYRVRVEFDEASGKVNVVTTPVGGNSP